jgi:hypothetical protein
VTGALLLIKVDPSWTCLGGNPFNELLGLRIAQSGRQRFELEVDSSAILLSTARLVSLILDLCLDSSSILVFVFLGVEGEVIGAIYSKMRIATTSF